MNSTYKLDKGQKIQKNICWKIHPSWQTCSSKVWRPTYQTPPKVGWTTYRPWCFLKLYVFLKDFRWSHLEIKSEHSTSKKVYWNIFNDLLCFTATPQQTQPSYEQNRRQQKCLKQFVAAHTFSSGFIQNTISCYFKICARFYMWTLTWHYNNFLLINSISSWFLFPL